MFRKNKIRLLDTYAWKYGNDDYNKDAYMACAFDTANIITYGSFIVGLIKMLFVLAR